MKSIQSAVLLALAVSAIPTWGQDATNIVNRAIATIHAENVDSLQVTGRGFDALLGQQYDGDSPWPRFALTRYRASFNFTEDSLVDERVRMQAQNPPRGGGNQPIPEQRQTLYYRNGVAWNTNAQGKPALAAEERDYRSAAEARHQQLLLTPVGFLHGAAKAKSTVRNIQSGDQPETVVSFTDPVVGRVEGTIDANNRVERVRTWTSTPLLGDVVYDATFSEYTDFDGILYPTHVVQSEGGAALLDIHITAIKRNGVAAPEAPVGLPQRKPDPAIVPQQIGEGIWILPNRDYHSSKSILVEFKDYLLIVEAPDDEERSIAVIDAAHKLVPRKPIRYLVNTHIHFDHSGGLRTYVAEGSALVVWDGDIAYYRQVLANPHTLKPDREEKAKKQPLFDGVVGNRVFTDGEQEVIVFHYDGNFHSSGMLGVYLPKQRAVIESDSFNPQPDAQDPPTAIPNLVQFSSFLDRQGFAVDHVIAIHGRTAPIEEVHHDIDLYKDSQLWQ